jgi:hypothetical protein
MINVGQNIFDGEIFGRKISRDANNEEKLFSMARPFFLGGYKRNREESSTTVSLGMATFSSIIARIMGYTREKTKKTQDCLPIYIYKG